MGYSLVPVLYVPCIGHLRNHLESRVIFGVPKSRPATGSPFSVETELQLLQ